MAVAELHGVVEVLAVALEDLQIAVLEVSCSASRLQHVAELGGCAVFDDLKRKQDGHL